MEQSNGNGKVCKDCGWGTCRCFHHVTIPILMILFATVFLLGYQGYISEDAVSFFWPMLVGVAGLVKLYESNCKCC